MNPLTPAPGTRNLDPERLGSLFVGVCIGFTLLMIFLWWTFHTQVAIAVLFIQDLELDLIGIFTSRFDVLHANLREAVPQHVSPGSLWKLSTITGSVLRWPVMLVIVALAILCLLRAPRELYRRRFGLDGMQAALARIHPLGAAWIGGSLKLSEPAPPGQDLRPMDPALRPAEWKARYMTGATPEKARANAAKALKAQLGTRWNDVAALSAVEKTLFLAFVLYIQRRKDDAQSLLEDFSEALSGTLRNGAPEKPATLPARYIRTLDERFAKEQRAAEFSLAKRHAWTRTALLTLLQQARLRSGVVNPGSFAAVQLVDRGLWLVLCAASYPRDGRPAHDMTIAQCMEAVAAFSHWRAECQGEAAIAEPDFSMILETLERQ